MTEVKVHRPQCNSCEHNIFYLNQMPMQYRGMTLQFGKRYCTGGKTIRLFRHSDPKIVVPTWCPKQNSPAILRIYGFKNIESRLIHNMLSHRTAPISPLAYRYAVRYTGYSDLSAYDFWRQRKIISVFELLGLDLYDGEVLEIDDGLMPYFFYKSNGGLVSVLFDGESARKN